MPSAAEEAILGAAGSAGACVVSHPLDTARARQALGLGVRAGPSLASGMGVAMAYNVVLNGARFGGLSVSTASGASDARTCVAIVPRIGSVSLQRVVTVLYSK